MSAGVDYSRIAEPVARRLLGDPNRELSKPDELRFGSRGSLAVYLETGFWADYETDEHGGVLDLVARELRVANGAAFDWLKREGFVDEVRFEERIVCVYMYQDATGAHLFDVVRLDRPKDFRQRSAGGDWSMKGVLRVLYRLPQLLAAPADALVFVTEGEKDADRLAGLGLVATTNPGGAGKWRDAYASSLVGRRVVVLADNDEPGRKHAEKVRASLEHACVEAAVVELEGLPLKGDASDWLDHGGTPARLMEIAEAALKAPKTAPNGAGDPERDREDPRTLPLVLDVGGRYPEACFENVGLILEGLRPWQGVFAFNELAVMVMLMRPIPGTSVPRATFRPRELRDGDVVAAARWFNRHLHPKTPHYMVGEVVQQVARQTIISPVKDYLDGLAWDGVERLDAWAITYLGAADTAFHRAAGRAWLISAAARALKPGVKADCALILEGPQGVLKSTALRTLASGPWFFDGLPDLHSKDASQALRGRWIIELPELSAMRRSDVEAVKAFLSRQVERYRPPYGREEVVEPRRCVFAGSTNSGSYLRDTTGNRRFWPVPVGTIDITALKRDRDQLWAEAVARFRASEPWWLDAAMEEVAVEVVAEREEEDPWLADFAEYLSGNKHETSTRDCLLAIGVVPERQTKALAMRAGDVLLALGWARSGRFNDRGPNRNLTRYVRP